MKPVLEPNRFKTVHFSVFKQTNSEHASKECRIVWDTCLSVSFPSHFQNL